ncbi:MauE/DoxX family redox-associated membrane protein [Phycicoccus avicenniae]|uniref:MauE/DoxX family redox-associated membrane protein n=1 Tax=Phycicoccus avicenniae TaxID=2828860 RepID=UPI003D29D0E8
MTGGAWSVLAVPFLAAAALLVLAGAPKVVRPGDLVRALRSTGLPAPAVGVRVFAAVEVLAGVAAVVVPSRVTGAAVAVLYAGFTAFVARALLRGGVLSSCGCFGKADTPPTWTHAALTGAAALVGAGVAVAAPADPWQGVGTGTAAGGLALVALVGFLAWQVMAVLPSVDRRAVRSASTRRV